MFYRPPLDFERAKNNGNGNTIDVEFVYSTAQDNGDIG